MFLAGFGIVFKSDDEVAYHQVKGEWLQNIQNNPFPVNAIMSTAKACMMPWELDESPQLLASAKMLAVVNDVAIKQIDRLEKSLHEKRKRKPDGV